MIRPILAFFFLVSVGLAQAQVALPALDGYVTAVGSTTDFTVDGVHVICDPRTQFFLELDPTSPALPWTNGPYIGQPLKVFGRRKGQTVTARKVVAEHEHYVQKEGFGIIDRVLSTDAIVPGQPTHIVVRADGMPVRIDGETKIRFDAPLTSLADITTNVWIDFKGRLQTNGVIVAVQAVFTKNEVVHRETKLRNKSEYDPTKVDPKQKQGKVSQMLIGTRVKRIPPYQDPINQARIERIGASLVPAYQRGLAENDPTKLQFRFQLIDVDWSDALAMPSGVILVPNKVVDRMQNDAQVAAILASAMASSLEKRVYRDQPAMEALAASYWAGQAGGLFVPGLGPAALVGTTIAAFTIEKHEREQCARVSLGLLEDAHYDIYQAPIAWWILSSNKTKDLTEISLPERAKYLYEVLGTTWKTGQMAQR